MLVLEKLTMLFAQMAPLLSRRQQEEGWPRHKEKYREASSDGADGVVWSRNFWTTPPRLRELMRLRDFSSRSHPSSC